MHAMQRQGFHIFVLTREVLICLACFDSKPIAETLNLHLSIVTTDLDNTHRLWFELASTESDVATTRSYSPRS